MQGRSEDFLHGRGLQLSLSPAFYFLFLSFPTVSVPPPNPGRRSGGVFVAFSVFKTHLRPLVVCGGGGKVHGERVTGIVGFRG